MPLFLLTSGIFDIIFHALDLNEQDCGETA